MYSRPNPKKVKKPRFLDSQDRHDSPRVEPQDESVNRHIKWMEDGTAVDVTSARSKTKRGEQSEEPKRKREEGGEVVARAHSDKRKKLATSHPSLEARSELRIHGAPKRDITPDSEPEEIEGSADEIDMLMRVGEEETDPSITPIMQTTGSSVGSVVRRAVSGLFATIVPATPSATNPPAAAATPAVTDEETVILRAECGDLQRQVKELKETVAALQAQLATAQREAIVVLDQDDIAKAHNRAQIAESALTQARRDLDNALACERELEREIRLNNDGFHRLHEDWIALGIETAQLRDSLAGMQERVTVVLQEKGAATKEVKRLRNQLDAHAQKALDAVPLDAFSNTLDQISEAQVLSSVEGLNEAISDFLSNLTLEAAQRVDAPAENESHELEFCEDEKRLWEALQTPCLDDEYRDLLLEAFLRTIILRAIHSLFFANVVLSFCVDEAQLMDNLYDKIRASESWTVAQRWKAFTAASFARILDASSWNSQEWDLSVRIVRIVQHVYHMPTAAATSLHEWVHGQLPGIYSQAHILSLQTKHDIISVNMRVVLSERSRFRSDECVPGWEGMDTKHGDEVLGQFSFGLLKVAENGTQTISLKPAVVTTSLLRCVGVATV